MKITVWGGSGFLGSHVSDALSNAGHEVIVADKQKSDYLRSDQKMFVGNILDESDILESISDSEAIFNFAGVADIKESNDDALNSAENNIIGNIKLLEGCKKLKTLKVYVLASSLYVYSNSGGFYRCSKQSSETYIEEYGRQFNIPYLILRFGSLYGPRSDENNGIKKYLKEAIASDMISFSGNENSRREYIHVEDASKICADLISEAKFNEYFTLTGTQSISMKDLSSLISEILGKEITLKSSESQKKDSSHYHITPYKYTSRKSKKYTLPIHTDLGEGLLELIQYIKNNKE